MEPVFKDFTASDGYRLSVRHWVPAGVPLAFVVALHGIQSHGGWYEFSSRRLCDAGFDVRFLDRRGSGRNGARRGDAPHADRLVNDVVQFVTALRHERDDLGLTAPVVLLSVSWGGKLAAVTAARRPELIDALALLYPGICARVGPSAWQTVRLWLARKGEIRHRRIAIPLNDPALFTAEPRWQEFIRRDPLALRDVTSGFLLAHQNLTRASLAAAPAIRCPVLTMLAGQDRIIDNGATRRWLSGLTSDDVWLREYPNAQHTLEFEPQPEVFISELLMWLNRVCLRVAVPPCP